MKNFLNKCALVALVGWSVSSPATAFAQDAGGDAGGNTVTTPTLVKSNDEAKNADELLGTEISYATRKEHWSVGNPTIPAEGQSNDDVMKRIFVFYNVKTGKYLNLGSWWGMRTVLSDAPYLFWMQRHNNQKITANNEVRYPLSKEETTVVPSLLEHMLNTHYERPRQIGIGSQQGKESFATYNKLQVVNQSAGNTVYTIATTKGTDGHFGEYHDIDLAQQRVEAVIDLSTCKNNDENILSVGSAINQWGWGDEEKHAVADNLHIYYNATDQDTKTLAAHELQVVYVGVCCNDANGLKKSFYNVLPSSPLKLSLTDKGLEVTVKTSDTYYDNVVSTLADGGKIQVGSQEGSTRSHATYKTLQIVKGDGTIDKIEEDDYQPDGAAFGANHDFDIRQDKVVAVIDLTSCKNANENILSIGRTIGKWLGYNLHFYYNQGNGSLEMDYTSEKEFTESTGRKTITLHDKTQPLYITMSKKGVEVSNGDASATTLFDGLNIPIGYGIGNAIEVGNVEGKNRSNATYKSVKIGSEDVTATFNSADQAKGTTVQRVIDIDTDKVEAEMDLSTCTGIDENVLSLGNDISAWNVGTWGSDKVDSIGRIHLYYTASNGQLKVYYIGRGQTQQFSLSVDKTTPLTVSLSKSQGLVINGTPYFGQFTIAYREGYEGEIVRFKNVKDNVPEMDSQGNYIIDDEGHGIQRVYTNYVYADESRSEKRQSYFLSSNFVLSSSASVNEGNFLAYTNLESDKGDCYSGVWGDRLVNTASGMNSRQVSQWSFNPVSDPSGKGQHLYTLSLTMRYDAEDPKGTPLEKEKQFYLAPTQKYVYGPEGNKWYDSDPDETGSYPDTTDLEDVELTSALSEACYWKVITLYDYRQVMDNSDSELKDQIDATYLISDPGFARENGDLILWNSTVDSEHLRIGYDGHYKTSPKDRDYVSTSEGLSARYNHARYMAANIYNGGRGRFCQTLKVFTPGWYVIHCKGMTNVGAKLFIEHDGRRNTKALTTVSSDELTKLRSSDVSVAKWPMDANMPLYNSAVWLNDPYRKNANPAKYDSQVLLYISGVSMDNPGDVTIGVEVPEGDKDVATADEWTVFDSFRILFGGTSSEKESFLILDEDKTSLDYIDKGVHSYIGKSLLLHRTFTLNKWNTFILPVDLTKAQFSGAFGEDSRLAYLTSLTPTRVNFTSVDIDHASSDDVVLKAGEPYIIKPTKAAGDEDTETGTQEIWTWESNAAQSEKVTVGTPYYTILGVTLNGPRTKGTNDFEHYNFTQMTDYYTDNIYVKATDGVDGDGQGILSMKGTYCKNYEGTSIIDGHATLNLSGNAYAYVMKDNTMRSLPQGQPYGTKGMRCWFEYKLNDAQAQATPKVFIDGVGDEVTSIDEVDTDNPMAITAGRYVSGVFYLNGQMVRQGSNTTGLPDGLYIVNGKKVVVRNNK